MRTNPRRGHLWWLLLFAWGLWMCSLPGLVSSSGAVTVLPSTATDKADYLSGSAQDATVTPDVAGGAPDQGGGGELYPTTPEGVVQQFLTAYHENPDEMNKYLSSSLLSQIPAGGVAEYIGLKGLLRGFAVQAASLDPAARTASVEVGLVAEDAEHKLVFSLVLQDSHWVIVSIQR